MDTAKLLDELLNRWCDAREKGEKLTPRAVCQDHPELLPLLVRRIHGLLHEELNSPSRQLPKSLSEVFRLEPGSEPVNGRYLVERLGRGRFGEVWKATTQNGNLRALKFAMSMEECVGWRLATMMRHRNLLTAYNCTVFRNRSSRPTASNVFSHTPMTQVIETELADQSLKEFLVAARQNESTLPLPTTFQIMRQIARGLDYLSVNNILHNDIKPANILLVRGIPKIGDFGSMRPTAHPPPAITPEYAAPERFLGKNAPTSDQYSLACLYCEMLTGNIPFQDDPVAKATADPDLSPFAPQDQSILVKALHHDPAQRFPTCGHFVEQLGQANKEFLPAELVSPIRPDPFAFSIRKNIRIMVISSRNDFAVNTPDNRSVLFMLSRMWGILRWLAYRLRHGPRFLD